MLAITGVFFNLPANPIFSIQIFDTEFMNNQLNHQLSGLVIVAITIAILYFFADKVRLSYLNFNRQGTMKPAAYLGIRQEGEWAEDGWSYGLIMIAIMGVTTFLGVHSLGFDFTLINTLMAVVFALTNAFIEEVLFRLTYVTMGENETTTSAYGLIMGSVVFGIIHYWGTMPNGIFGAIISALLGFFLAKSMQETKGFYWAFMIHFALDVVIMVILFNAQL